MKLQIISQEEIKTASEVLETTKKWVANYAKRETSLVLIADKEGVKLSVETDSAINDFLASLKKAIKSANEARAPFTRRLDEIKGLFTAEENALKALETRLQEKRNASVKVYAQEKAEQERKDQLKLDQAKARIELLAEAEAQIRNQYAGLLANDKARLLAAFEEVTLENIEILEQVLHADVAPLSEDVWSGVNARISSELVPDEVEAICVQAKEGKYDKVAPHYQTEIKNYANYLLSLLPERKVELEEGKASAAAEKLRLQQEAEAKKQEVQSELKQAEQVKSQIGAAIVDVQIDQAKRGSIIPKTQAIESYSIEVLEQAGWAEIFKFYTTHCDKLMTEKTTLGTMKIFAEAEAKRNGVVIESEYLHYEPTYKAVTKSKKVA